MVVGNLWVNINWFKMTLLLGEDSKKLTTHKDLIRVITKNLLYYSSELSWATQPFDITQGAHSGNASCNRSNTKPKMMPWTLPQKTSAHPKCCGGNIHFYTQMLHGTGIQSWRGKNTTIFVPNMSPIVSPCVEILTYNNYILGRLGPLNRI